MKYVTKKNILHFAFAASCCTSGLFLIGTGLLEARRIVK